MFYMWTNWIRMSLGLNAVLGGPVVKECDGCAKATYLMCTVYEKPAAHWNRGGCYFNTKQVVETVGKKRIGQQKQKRKGV